VQWGREVSDGGGGRLVLRSGRDEGQMRGVRLHILRGRGEEATSMRYSALSCMPDFMDASTRSAIVLPSISCHVRLGTCARTRGRRGEGEGEGEGAGRSG